MPHIPGHIEEVLGGRTNLSGQQIFLLANTRLAFLGQPALLVAPEIPVFDLFSLVSLTAIASTGAINLSFAPAVPADTLLVIKATEPISQGISYFSRSLFSFLLTLDSGILSPQSLAAAYIAKHGAITTKAGLQIAIQAYYVSKSTGLSSQRVRITGIIQP